jgi:uncharacterized membrane protein YcaP (DUF421 family)
LLKSVAITEAAAAIAILSAAQWLTTKLVLKSDIVAGIVKDEPTLLTSKGEFLREGMKKTRVSEEEVMSALRANGMTSLDDANWVILETNGEFSVIPKDDAELDELPALSSVNRPGG